MQIHPHPYPPKKGERSRHNIRHYKLKAKTRHHKLKAKTRHYKLKTKTLWINCCSQRSKLTVVTKTTTRKSEVSFLSCRSKRKQEGKEMNDWVTLYTVHTLRESWLKENQQLKRYRYSQAQTHIFKPTFVQTHTHTQTQN